MYMYVTIFAWSLVPSSLVCFVGGFARGKIVFLHSKSAGITSSEYFAGQSASFVGKTIWASGLKPPSAFFVVVARQGNINKFLMIFTVFCEAVSGVI